MLTVDSPPQQLAKKLVAVISEKLEPGVAMNALAHMALGMGTALGPEAALMCNYADANGGAHPFISACPFIILKGRPGKIREAVAEAKNRNVMAVDFVNTMTVGSYVEQLARTKETPADALEYCGAVFFGDTAAVSEVTRKFSLYR